MPRHMHYVEPFAGGLAVLLERDPNDTRLWLSEKSGENGVSEVVNDLNSDLTNFWRVLQSEEQFKQFHRIMQAMSLSKEEWELADARMNDPFIKTDPVKWAAAFFVACRQSRAGQFQGFTTLTRSRTRRGVNGNSSEWLSAVERLPEVHARLRPVVIENMDALDLIKREDTPNTLYYLDPPYLHDTRTTTDGYAHEMTAEQHRDLIVILGGRDAASACTRANEQVPDWYATAKSLKGKFMLSGYRSPLYDAAASVCGWKRHDFDIANHAAGGGTKRRMTECLWINY